MSSESSIVPLESASAPACGGKAASLARLLAAGLDVPPGFVVVGARPGALPEGLEEAYAALGRGAVAVRSSAAAEDGARSSYAGIFESVLEVEGAGPLRQAIARCLESAADARVRAYVGAAAEEVMSVIVQRMVAARCAGVLFTVDPRSGDASRWRIEAVRGLGEALVSGRARPDRYTVDPDTGAVLERELCGEAAILSDDAIAALVCGAKRAQAELGPALDLEWAIDGGGRIRWLQARPVTRTGAVDLSELDGALALPTPGFARYNIGEILPGAVTPLTATTIVPVIDGGFTRLYVRMGIFDADDPPDRIVLPLKGHLFLNMRAPYLFAAKFAGANKDDADRNLGGRVLDDLQGYAPRGRWRRLRTAAKALPRLRRAAAEVARVEALVAAADVDGPTGAASIDDHVAALNAAIELGVEVCEAHMLTSTWSGMITSALERIISGGPPPTPSQRSACASLLQGIGAVESADVGRSSAAVRAALRDDERAASRLADADDAALLAWLTGPESGEAGRRWRALLAEHGHRCVRELELVERDWSEDPSPLLAVLRLASEEGAERAPSRPAEVAELGLPSGRARGARWVLPKVRGAIRLRERSKSLLVRVARRIKRRCVALGEAVVAGGGLLDRDAIFFLTRGELVALARDPSGLGPAMAQTAARRRHTFACHRALRLPMFCCGDPEPLPPEPAPEGLAELRGIPVSGGVVEGPARVARTPAEASAMRPGEILVVPYTDAGWTPYFGVAAGLATEIGGTLSHGAVVARELGLPAVVDLRRATERVRTGQRVRLDADAGVLQALEP